MNADTPSTTSSITLGSPARNSRRKTEDQAVAVRVQLLDDALADLIKLSESGKLRSFLKKLVEVEQKGSRAGVPLARNLTSWRKLTVGDRNWRIVFRVSPDETVATICVIGD